MKRQLIFAVVFAVPALALGIIAATVATTLSLQSDVAVLAKRARNAAHAEKALRAEVAEVKDQLAALQAQPPAAAEAESAPAQAATAPAPASAAQPVAAVPARAVLASANVPHECTFRAGGSAGLMDCIRQQQDSSGRFPTPSLYR